MWDMTMHSQAAQFSSSAVQVSSMAAARNDPETMILGRREMFLLLTNHPKLLLALMNFSRRKPVVGGMAHRDSSHPIAAPSLCLRRQRVGRDGSSQETTHL